MRSLVSTVLPIASAWVRRQEKMILREGAPLDDDQIADARRIGVVHPERVRTLVVKTIPPRLSRPIAALAARRRGQDAVLRALSRHQRSAGSVSAF